jgi:hypothetical protein
LPLSAKARIEIYLPDALKREYQDLLFELTHEFTYTFGGATVLRGLDGSFLSQAGDELRDRVNLPWTDTHLTFPEDLHALSEYGEYLRKAAMAALNEEAVLIVTFPVYHAD